MIIRCVLISFILFSTNCVADNQHYITIRSSINYTPHCYFNKNVLDINLHKIQKKDLESAKNELHNDALTFFSCEKGSSAVTVKLDYEEIPENPYCIANKGNAEGVAICFRMGYRSGELMSIHTNEEITLDFENEESDSPKIYLEYEVKKIGDIIKTGTLNSQMTLTITRN